MKIFNAVDVDTWIDNHPTAYRVPPLITGRAGEHFITYLNPPPVAGPLRARVQYRWLHITGRYVDARSDRPLALVEVLDVNGNVVRTAVGPSLDPAENINYAHELIREMPGVR